MPTIMRQLFWFVVVGCAAAATHWLAVVLIVRLLGVAALLANVIGWLIAFCVSFTGHYRLTFTQHRVPVLKAARRFFAVSAMGFAVNELLYAYLLHVTTLRYDVLLAIILLGIAIMTFILGRFWAFRHKN